MCTASCFIRNGTKIEFENINGNQSTTKPFLADSHTEAWIVKFIAYRNINSIVFLIYILLHKKEVVNFLYLA